MANNFRITGQRYVAKGGNDGNSGTSADSPKATMTSVMASFTANSTGNMVVGTGVYREGSVSLGYTGGSTGGNTATITLMGDGIVTLDSNSGTMNLTNQFGFLITLNNLRLLNLLTWGKTGATTGSTLTVVDCFFDNCGTNTNSSAPQVFTRCVFIGVTFSATTTSTFTNCKFFNCTFTTTTGTYVNCYFDDASIPRNLTVVTTNNNNFAKYWRMDLNSVVTSGVIIDKNLFYYDLSHNDALGTGTIGDPFGRLLTSTKEFGLAEHKIAYAQNVQSITGTPYFNNVAIKDFTCASNSPLLLRNSTTYNQNIGNAEYAVAFYPNTTPELLQNNGAIIDNLTGTTDLTITSGNSGYIQSSPINFGGSSILEIGAVNYIGALTYDKSATVATSRNQNVPDAVEYTYANGTGGGIPDRLVYEFRFSTKASVAFTALSGTSNASTTITMANTTGILVGQEVSGVGIPSGTTVVSIITNTSIVISASATTSQTQKLAFTTLSDWDNANLATAGTFVKSTWFSSPLKDTSNVFSGEPNFNAVQGVTVGATYIQVKITLSNAYSLT